MTGDPTPQETIEQRQQRLREELDQIEQLKREQAEHERQQQQAERQAQLTPELRAEAAAIEQRAEEELDREYPPAWKPTKPEEQHPQTLVGMIERINPSVGPSPTYGNYSAVLEIASTTGERWSVWAQHGGVVFQQMARLRLQPGDVVAIRYEGLRESTTSGFKYQNYKVRRLGDDKGLGHVDYDQLARQQEGDQAALPAPAEPAPEPDDDIPF